MYTSHIIDSEALETFYKSFTGSKTFLHSARYAKYRMACNEKIRIEGYFKENQLVAVCLIQCLSTKLKHWFHVPHGPLVLPEHHDKFWPWWLQHFQNLGQTHKQDLVRVSPLVETTQKINFESFNFKPAAVHLVNPETTWVLDITKSEEDLLAEMKKSTRYEVRKGIKEETGFTITIDKNLETFWELHEATVARQGFVPFTRQSTEAEIKAFGKDCEIITVWHEGKALASGVFLFDDKAGYYHQGASVPSKLPAAHAYLWAAICEAKKRGCTEFNFWGVCEEEETQHPWYGLSKFKRGFGGEQKNYHHVHDFEITCKAKLNRMIEARRNKKRGY
ncbi:peptidoglycan bridge formation glycyltransferase FemA/FemB family protein [bacterium]|nr:peptidoglycan bridge formation glycyltransferase FemA/FemB family protein [bacterium]NCQ55373.1 peptidoglycan bridge formation glycyltransferase FemA/FemB family protein [Candidatus Parcubacteria bacterium]NCS67735.1 peptidoglycan bridge formation glycyltransferase FemA/FemB family protein [Candidatus Peregrinibacteria bacterium]NCS96451.1 peptidoglycan bridge formation glycyltransferase FemA/FemB family protein [bacterium]